MPKRNSESKACSICPNEKIHRVHEKLAGFELLRTIRREDRVAFWASSILSAARRSGKRMAAAQADHLAWRLQNEVENELRPDRAA